MGRRRPKMRFGRRTTGIAAMILTALFAASSASAEGRIEKRKDRQQARIGQGVSSGQLTPRETARLERREGALNREERAMRAADGGRLTPRDRRTIERQQDRLSRDIYRQKHDAQHR